MQRRRFLQASFAGVGAVGLAGCSESTVPTPATVADTDSPRFKDTVTVSADPGFWALKLPRFESGEALYRYEVEHVSGTADAFDVLFFDHSNFDEYTSKGETTWYGPLTAMNVSDRAEKTDRFRSYGDLFGDLYLVLDGTGYGAADAIDDDTSFEVNLKLEVFPEGVGHLPEVGEIRVQPDPDTSTGGAVTIAGSGRDWQLVVDVAEEFRGGELKIYPCDRYRGTCTEATAGSPAYRRSLHDTNGVERFSFRRSPELGFPVANYVFVIEQDDEIVAHTIFGVERSVTASAPQFESFGRVEEYESSDVYEEGKIGFSVRVKNTGDVPVWLTDVYITQGVDEYSAYNGFWLFEDQQDQWEQVGFRLQLDPDDSIRIGATGYNLPLIDEVESICSGESTEAILEVATQSKYVAEHRFSYVLDEPAAQIGAPEWQQYACLEGSISDFKRTDDGY